MVEIGVQRERTTGAAAAKEKSFWISLFMVEVGGLLDLPFGVEIAVKFNKKKSRYPCCLLLVLVRGLLDLPFGFEIAVKIIKSE